MIFAIIQARMGSTRLPSKVLKTVEGKPILWHVVERVGHSKNINGIIVATTYLDEDKKIIEVAKKLGVKSFAGSEDDVLDRYYQSAKKYNADVIVRITSDCPFVDPVIIDKTIEYFKNNDFDYVSTGHITGQEHKSKYPDGLDTEVFSFSALKRAWEESKLASDREHVTPYIWRNKDLFKIGTIDNDKDLSYMRWTVDEEKDLRFVREIYKKLYSSEKIFLTEDILTLLSREPNLIKINENIVRDEGYIKSLLNDNKKNG